MRLKKAWRWSDLPQLVDCETLAKLLQKNVRDVQKQCKAGTLPAKKICNRWYIDTEQLRGVFNE